MKNKVNEYRIVEYNDYKRGYIMYWKIGFILTIILMYTIVYFYGKSELEKAVELSETFFESFNNLIILEQVLERTE